MKTEAGTVLVVDDEDGVRRLCRMILEIGGFKVLEADNGLEAKRILEHSPGVELLITDVIMPGMAGPDLVRAVLEEYPGLAVLYISGATGENGLMQRHIREDGCGFLGKPFSPAALIRSVNQILKCEHPRQIRLRGPRSTMPLYIPRTEEVSAGVLELVGLRERLVAGASHSHVVRTALGISMAHSAHLWEWTNHIAVATGSQLFTPPPGRMLPLQRNEEG